MFPSRSWKNVCVVIERVSGSVRTMLIRKTRNPTLYPASLRTMIHGFLGIAYSEAGDGKAAFRCFGIGQQEALAFGDVTSIQLGTRREP